MYHPLIAVIVAYSLFLLGCSRPAKQAETPIRIGWQTEWATEGQLASILKRTNIFNAHGIAASFNGFSYGGPLNESALAGQVDIIFTADQPAITLIARTGSWKIVSRLIDFRSCLVVPPDSPLKSVASLKGKTVVVPFGSGTHRILLSMLMGAGLAPDRDVHLRNLDITEEPPLAQTASEGMWKGVQAMASWDPTVALLEWKKLARALDCRRALAVIVVSQGLIDRAPDAVVRFLQSFRLAYAYYALHSGQANEWFAQETGAQLPALVLDASSAVERNMKAKSLSDIQISLSDADLTEMQQGADFGLAYHLTTTAPDIRKAVDLSFLAKAVNSPERMTINEVKAK